MSFACARPARAENAPGKGVRTIYLVRHGVYDEDDPSDPDVGKALIPEGREQARLTGARLAGLPVKIDALYASSMTRARQTAEIIGAALKLEPQLTPDIRECTPPTDRKDVLARETPGEPDSCRQRIESAFARFFRPSPDRDSAEVVVAHGNVIRWFTCHALGADPRLWLNMGTTNCGITTIQVRPDGKLRLVSYSDFGHLPPRLQTTAWHRRASGDSAMMKP
jgi:serine/threonine-protein phosphatase PGAM5